MYSVTIYEQKRKTVIRQGASNISYSAVAFICDVCRLS